MSTIKVCPQEVSPGISVNLPPFVSLPVQLVTPYKKDKKTPIYIGPQALWIIKISRHIKVAMGLMPCWPLFYFI